MATNSLRGEVEITICGERHRLRFTLGALRELKERFGAGSVADIFKASDQWGPDDIAFLFWSGLRRGSLPDATVEDVEEMMILQEMPHYAEALTAAFNAANTGSTETPKRDPSADPTTTSPRDSATQT